MTIREKLTKEIISKGGKVTSENKKKWHIMCLRLTTDLLEKIDIDLVNRIGMKRTSWILEAIQEKLNKEK